jgi:[ribosomal protein S18]-alanine N-acetyltransferase
MTVRLLEPRAGDFRMLAALHAKGFDQPWSEAALADLVANGTFIVIVGPESSPAGFVAARLAADEAEILTLVVAPESRRLGLGHALVRAAAAHAEHLGAKMMFLEVDVANEVARSLYERLGFSVVGIRGGYYRDSGQNVSDALTLKADLPLPSMGKADGSQ